MKKYFYIILGLIIIILLIFGFSRKNFVNKTPKVFVTILPQKYLLERITQNKIDIEVMVKKGFSPESYEPLPRQILAASLSDIYFAIGINFEEHILEKVRKINMQLNVVDTSKEIVKRQNDLFLISQESNDHSHNHKGLDPHVWLDPQNAKEFARLMYYNILRIDNQNKDLYTRNYRKLKEDLDAITLKIEAELADIENREIIVFHPAFGYFTDAFGLKQIPIEIEGKEPSPGHIAKIINYAKENNIKTIFAQDQFSLDSAEVIAKEIDAKVVLIDPLAENYLDNLLKIARAIKNSNK